MKTVENMASPVEICSAGNTRLACVVTERVSYTRRLAHKDGGTFITWSKATLWANGAESNSYQGLSTGHTLSKSQQKCFFNVPNGKMLKMLKILECGLQMPGLFLWIFQAFLQRLGFLHAVGSLPSGGELSRRSSSLEKEIG